VHRPFQQQQQRCSAHVAAAAPRSAPWWSVGSEAEASAAPTPSSPWSEVTAALVPVFLFVFSGSWIHLVNLSSVVARLAVARLS